ncbi:MAG: hypothetical protein M3X11_16125 [Acidobacteriota bacterium]|nr:hypothetical protein [Acidobacteriota bacterium]
MRIWFLFVIVCLLLAAPAACAQTTAAEQVPPDEQNETMRDTFKRMQIKREEDEHKKIVGKGSQIKEDIQALTREATDGRLPRAAEKRLKDIEKSAKQIRSGSGGSQDDPLESPPGNLADALKRLDDVSTKLNDHLAKTSRRMISIAVVEDATEIIQLVKILRSYLN